MDIAAMSMQMSLSQVQTNVGLAMVNKAMDTTEAQANGLLEMIEQATPSFGHTLDIRV